jgi:hypothetical protein
LNYFLDNLSHVANLETLLEILLGISLSAAVGFRVFVPLLVLSAAAVFGHLDYPASLDWAESPQALIVLAVACLLEMGGYYIPWFDHALDIVSTPAAIIAGTAVSASLIPNLDPIAQWTLALVAGGGTAGLTKGLMNIVRATSTAASGGLTNPILSTFEWITAAVLSVLAISLPVFTGLLVIGSLGFALYKIGKFFFFRRTVQLDEASRSEEITST